MKKQTQICTSLVVLLYLALLLTGCAKVVIYDGYGRKTKGLTFYESKTYLNLSYDTTGKAKFEFFWLPDHSKKRTAQLKPGFGTASLTLKLANGGQLAEYGSTSDSKIPETITAITGAIKEIASIAKGKDEEDKNKEELLAPGIYEVTTGSGTIILTPIIKVHTH